MYNTIPYPEHYFTKLFLDYTSDNNCLKPYYEAYPSKKAFSEKLITREFNADTRQVLHTIIKNQYQNIDFNHKVTENIDLLAKSNTFTITAGHQLNLFTGPLYFIYKLVSVIKLTEELKKEHPQHNFVPVYWMASEDHDFAEINHFNLFGQKLKWENEQQGAVGRFNLQGMETFLDGLPAELDHFTCYYRESPSLASATRKLVNKLFGEYGLIVLDADAPELKRFFTPVIAEELSEQTSHEKVSAATNHLTQLGYKGQIHAREINLFYLDNGLRERIVEQNGIYKVLNTDLSFTSEEIQDLAKTKPEHFSPNVVLRPLYQELILPNLSFTGGPAELAYWMQLKPLFKHYNVSFPILVPRNFALYINKASAKKLDKIGISNEELFLPWDVLKKHIVDRAQGDTLHFEKEHRLLAELAEILSYKSKLIDASLQGYVGAETNKMQKQLTDIEKRLSKAAEKKETDSLGQLETVYQKLFPNGSLQERHDNVFNILINKPDFISDLMTDFDPLKLSFSIITEE